MMEIFLKSNNSYEKTLLDEFVTELTSSKFKGCYAHSKDAYKLVFDTSKDKNSQYLFNISLNFKLPVGDDELVKVLYKDDIPDFYDNNEELLNNIRQYVSLYHCSFNYNLYNFVKKEFGVAVHNIFYQLYFLIKYFDSRFYPIKGVKVNKTYVYLITKYLLNHECIINKSMHDSSLEYFKSLSDRKELGSEYKLSITELNAISLTNTKEVYTFEKLSEYEYTELANRSLKTLIKNLNINPCDIYLDLRNLFEDYNVPVGILNALYHLLNTNNEDNIYLYRYAIKWITLVPSFKHASSDNDEETMQYINLFNLAIYRIVYEPDSEAFRYVINGKDYSLEDSIPITIRLSDDGESYNAINLPDYSKYYFDDDKQKRIYDYLALSSKIDFNKYFESDYKDKLDYIKIIAKDYPQMIFNKDIYTRIGKYDDVEEQTKNLLTGPTLSCDAFEKNKFYIEKICQAVIDEYCSKKTILDIIEMKLNNGLYKFIKARHIDIYKLYFYLSNCDAKTTFNVGSYRNSSMSIPLCIINTLLKFKDNYNPSNYRMFYFKAKYAIDIYKFIIDNYKNSLGLNAILDEVHNLIKICDINTNDFGFKDDHDVCHRFFIACNDHDSYKTYDFRDKLNDDVTVKMFIKIMNCSAIENISKAYMTNGKLDNKAFVMDMLIKYPYVFADDAYLALHEDKHQDFTTEDDETYIKAVAFRKIKPEGLMLSDKSINKIADFIISVNTTLITDYRIDRNLNLYKINNN